MFVVGRKRFGSYPIRQPFASRLAGDVPQARTHFAFDTGDRLRVIGNLLGFSERLRLKPEVRANRFAGIEAVDVVTAEAAILLDELPAFVNLRCRRPEFGVLAQLNNRVVTLQTSRLTHSRRLHRVFPEMVVEPAILVLPLVSLMRFIGRVRHILKIGC